MCDKTSADSFFDALRKRVRAEGKGPDIDILVANAGSIEQGETLLDFALKAVRGAFETNVFGNLNLVRAYLAPEAPAIPMQAIPPGNGKIVLNVSTAVMHMRSPGHSVYSSSKLAFTHMMKHLQWEVDQLPGAPVRIHSFNPGVIFTPGARKTGASEEILAHFPFDDGSLPEGFAVWLASPAAAFLKGRFVWSSWDVEELVAMKHKLEEDPEFCQMTVKGL